MKAIQFLVPLLIGGSVPFLLLPTFFEWSHEQAWHGFAWGLVVIAAGLQAMRLDELNARSAGAELDSEGASTKEDSHG